MTRFVIDPGAALRLAENQSKIPEAHQLVAPTLLRSQVLAKLYASVRTGRLEQKEAERQLDYLRGLRIRLLGDRVLQKSAWQVADQFGWPDTYMAEYVALTQIQADAFVTLDKALAETVRDVVTLASFDAITSR